MPAKKNNGTASTKATTDDEPLAKKPAKRAPAKKAPAKKNTVISISDEDDDLPVTKPVRKPRAAASKPKRKYNSSSDSDDVFKSPSTSSKLFIYTLMF